MKRSDDGGLTWSERLPTPASWATLMETPTVLQAGPGRRGVDEPGGGSGWAVRCLGRGGP